MITVNTIEQAYKLGEILKAGQSVKIADDYDTREALHTTVFNCSAGELDVKFIDELAVIIPANIEPVSYTLHKGQIITV